MVVKMAYRQQREGKSKMQAELNYQALQFLL